MCMAASIFIFLTKQEQTAANDLNLETTGDSLKGNRILFFKFVETENKKKTLSSKVFFFLWILIEAHFLKQLIICYFFLLHTNY